MLRKQSQLTLTFFILLFTFLLSANGCTTIYNPATEQKETYFVTTSMEVSLGNNVASKIKEEFNIIKDDERAKKVNEIGAKIARISDRKDLKYSFEVLEDKGVNAFTIPGGHVYVSTGLLKEATDDELACVIGHEVGHVAARHIAKKLQSQIGYDILMNIAASKANIKDIQKAVSITYDFVMLGYSRKDELLADQLAIKYAYKAGYDPYAMLSFLEKLKKLNDEIPGLVFLRSHPYTSDRIKLLKPKIPKIIDKANEKKLPKARVEPVKREQESIKVMSVKTKSSNVKRKMCPACKKVFPGKYIYCPHDGTQLQ